MKRTKAGPEGRPLNDKQERFCHEYLVDLNVTKAAIRAGYAAKSACQVGCRLLSGANISARIAELKQARNSRTDVEGDRILTEIKALAYAQIPDFLKVVRGKVQLKDFTELTDDQRRAIRCIYRNEQGLRLEIWDKLEALEKLGRHAGIFEKDNQQRAVTVNVVDYSKAETPGYDANGQPIRSDSKPDKPAS